MGLGIEGGDNDNIIEIKIITFTVVKPLAVSSQSQII